MKKIFAFSIVVFFAHFLLAQDVVSPKGNGKVTGIVRDSTSSQPVEFANIALLDPSTKKPVNGAVADEKGKFSVIKIPNGNYVVEISFIGYSTKRIPVKIGEKRGEVELGFVALSANDKVLNEVVVQGQKNLIEERVDRTIYNAENDATTRGGDATDVLKRVPMLSVDLDGNVSMRGSSNIRVLINNKPSTIAASSIADALKQIPADQIKTVEVITSPSAKYDAEGSGGIINIITKKNTLQGLTLNVDASAGLRGSNLGLNGNYRTGKMGFSLGGFGRSNYNQPGSFENDQKTFGRDILTGNRVQTSQSIQSADTRTQNIFGRYTLGWDYDINEKNSLAASLQYGVRNNSNWQDLLRTNSINNPLRSNLYNVDVTDNSGTVDASLTYTRLFKKPQQELSFLGSYSQNNRANDFVRDSLDFIITERLKSTKNNNKSINTETTIQIDYQTPIGKKSILEFGGKQIIRRVESSYAYFVAGANGMYTIDPNASLSNIFNYNQNVTGGYTAYTLSLPKSYSLKAGGRYEYTTIDAFFQNEKKIALPSYGILVPSVNVSKKLKNGSAFKVAYNRRIQRPSIQFLNPNIQASNPLNISVGNPNLDPEYTDNYELSYSTFIKGTSLNFSTFSRNTTGSIQRVRETSGDTIKTTYQNIGQEDAYGLSVFANVNAGKLSLNGGVDTYYALLNNNSTDATLVAKNSGWVYNVRLFGSYNLDKGWGLQFFSFYRGQQVQLQGYQGGFGVYSLSVRKDIADKKGSIGFGAENFFYPSITVKGSQNSYFLNQETTSVTTNINFKITFSYRIGKMSMDGGRKRKKSINNDDLKEEGGGDGQQGGGGMPQGGGGGRGQAPTATVVPAQSAPTNTNTPKDTVAYEAVGAWNYTIESPQGGMGTLTIKKEGAVYSGTIANNRSKRENPIKDVVYKNNQLSFTYEVNFGGNTAVIAVKGTITKDQFTGTMSVGQFGAFPMNATRKVD
jgi:outer membrane receptor protein involved in Fe transport